MSESLRDQLLKAGFAPKPKAEAKPAASQQPRGPRSSELQNNRPQNKGAQNNRPQKNGPQRSFQKPPQPQHAAKPNSMVQEPNLAHAYALRAKQEKDERDRAQREIERLAQEKRERKQRLSNLLSSKSLNTSEADTPRHFPHGNKIRRIYCTADQLVELNRGNLGVVQLAGRYLLVHRDIALQAQTIDESSLVLLCDPNATAEDDVPVDLIW